MPAWAPGPAVGQLTASEPSCSSSGDRKRRMLDRGLLPFASVTTAAKPRDTTVSTPSTAPAASSSAPAPSGADKPAHDVVAGAMARAASQGTIHPLDTMKVRMQAGSYGVKPTASGHPSSPAVSSATATAAGAGAAAAAGAGSLQVSLRRGLTEVASLYKGVVSAATGAGVIIGAYFAFYSTSKRYLRNNTDMPDGQVAFVSGAVAAVGSSVVKVPIAVCIRSVQAGVYPNVVVAAKSIVRAAGPTGLFTGFLPTLMEDVPDMAVKFAVYETLRQVHCQWSGVAQPSAVEDLVMGGTAGAAAAAATTPLDVVKTRMMCSASSRPSFVGAVKTIMAEGEGVKSFFRGVGPRALSNGINSAVFFCFFEAIRRVLVARQEEAAAKQRAGGLQTQAAAAAAAAATVRHRQQQQVGLCTAGDEASGQQQGWQQQASLATSSIGGNVRHRGQGSSSSSNKSSGSGSDPRLACLSLAIPLPLAQGWN